MRIHQWAKNLLVFLPVLLSHRLQEKSVLIHAGLAMLCFSLTASAVYVMNDLLDLESDIAHPTKRLRPLASGELSIPQGRALLLLLLIGATAASALLVLNGRLLLAGYVAINLAYTTWLKRLFLIDAVALAGFYSMRVLVGGVATGIQISAWTLVFSSFFFLSLALAKRLGELKYLDAGRQSPGRGYLEADRDMVASLAKATSLTAILVLALYIRSPAVELLYSRPDLLLLICPLLAYWLWRLLILANRGRMNEDAVVFVFNDRVSYAIGVVIAILIWIAV